jgi:hypothetical protein
MRDHGRPQVDVDPIGMNLSPSDKRAKDVESLLLAARRDRSDDIFRGGERAPDAGRVPASRRQRVRDSVGTGKEGSQALDNETVKLGGRKALSGFLIALPLRPNARDQPA